jgi:hypothetical protein
VRTSRIQLSDWLHREAHGGDPMWTRRRRGTPRFPKKWVSLSRPYSRPPEIMEL